VAAASDVVDLRPDAVVVATGGQVVVPDVAGAELPHVHEGPALREVLAGRAGLDAPTWQRVGARLVAGRGQRLVRPAVVRAATRAWLPLGHRVAIVGGDLVAVELAEHVASRGRLVCVLEAGDTLAPEVGWKRRTEHMDRLDRLGVTVHTQAEVERIVPTGLRFRPMGGTVRDLPADDVVLAGTLEPDLALHDAVVAALPDVPVHSVGDCTGLGLIQKATEQGARAACSI
jgi:2,4-dienoyl-CoA reductase (NADPH2)